MEYGQAKKIIEQLKQKVTDEEKHAIELIQNEVNDAQEAWTTLYIKGAFDKNQDWINKIKELIEQLEKEGYWNFLEERDLDITKNILKDLLKEEDINV